MIKLKEEFSGRIPFDMVSAYVILRDYCDLSDDNYINNEHKMLVDLADSIYALDLSEEELLSLLAKKNKQETIDIYNKYGSEYFDTVLRDIDALDSQIGPNNVGDLIAEVNDKMSAFQ